MTRDVLIHQPRGHAHGLVLLLHGVGGSADSLAPLGRRIAQQRGDAVVACVQAPHASDDGRGFQWFSLEGVDDGNRPQRVAAAMPAFLAAVTHWQQRSSVDAARTVLVGFSQGAMMALESTQQPEPPAAEIVALAGRLSKPAERPARPVVAHLLHGEDDAVIPASHSREAAARFKQLGVMSTLDVVPGVGHTLDPRLLQKALRLLR